jgi:hypothetical protein
METTTPKTHINKIASQFFLLIMILDSKALSRFVRIVRENKF